MGCRPWLSSGICKPQMPACRPGRFSDNNQEVRVDAGNLFTRREDLEAVVVGVVRGHPVYLRDVADKIVDGAAEPSDYVVYGTTNAGAGAQQGARQYPAVTDHRGQAQRNQRNRHLECRSQARA